MSHRRSVAITVATLMAASLAPVTPAMALTRAVQVSHTPVSCVFNLPTLFQREGRTGENWLTAGRRANDCADGPLADIGLALSKVPSEALAVPPEFREAVAAGRAIAAPLRTGTSIGRDIADQAPAPIGGFFPGRIQPIPPSPIR